jgi:hypothetical protein
MPVSFQVEEPALMLNIPSTSTGSLFFIKTFGDFQSIWIELCDHVQCGVDLEDTTDVRLGDDQLRRRPKY